MHVDIPCAKYRPFCTGPSVVIDTERWGWWYHTVERSLWIIAKFPTNCIYMFYIMNNTAIFLKPPTKVIPYLSLIWDLFSSNLCSMFVLDVLYAISGVLCQKQVSRAGTCNYIPQILWGVITCPCPWYLVPTQHSSHHVIVGHVMTGFCCCIHTPKCRET